MLTILALLLTPAARAGTLTVSALAAAPGGGDSSGLSVTLSATCPFAADVTVSSPSQIEGEYSACSTLTGENVEVVGPTVFSAPTIALGDGFTVAAGADFTATLAMPSVPFAYVLEDSPQSETTFSVSWEINLDSATLGTGDLFSILAGYSAAGGTHLEALIRHNASPDENRLVVRTREDGGGTADTLGNELVLPAGWSTIELRWAAGPGNGYLLARVNGAGGFSGLTGLDNDGSRVDLVRFGAVAGDADSSTGNYFLDEYVSFR